MSIRTKEKYKLNVLYIVFFEKKQCVSNISILVIFLKPFLSKSRSIISPIILGKFKTRIYFSVSTKSKFFVGLYFRGLVIFRFFAEEIFTNLAKICKTLHKKVHMKIYSIKVFVWLLEECSLIQFPFCNKVNVQLLNWREYCQFHFYSCLHQVF